MDDGLLDGLVSGALRTSRAVLTRRQALSAARQLQARTNIGVAAGTGTVTSVSVTSANGISGTVATATTTPEITLSAPLLPVTFVDSAARAAATPLEVGQIGFQLDTLTLYSASSLTTGAWEGQFNFSGAVNVGGPVNIGTPGVITGDIQIFGQTSGSIILTVPDAASSGTITLNAGTNTFSLTNGTASMTVPAAANPTFPAVTGTVAVATASATPGLALFTTSTSGAPFYADPDAEAFLLAVTNAGGSYDATKSAAVRTLVSGLKSNGLWPKFSAFYPFVGGDADSHSLNLIDPTQFRIKWQGTVTHSANGVTGNGSTGYGDTRNFPLRSWSWTRNGGTVGVYVYTAGTAGAPTLRCYIGGLATFSTELTMYGHLTTGGQGFYASVNQTSQSLYAVAGTSKKLLLVTRIDTTNETLYYDDGTGTLQSSNSTPTINNAIDAPICLLAYSTNINGSSGDRFNDATISAAFIGEGMTSGNASTLKTLLDAFQASMSRSTP